MLSNLKRTKGTPAVIHVVTNHFITELVKTDWPLNKTEENMIKCLLTPQPYLSEQPIYSLIYAKMYAYSFSLVLLPIYFLNQGTKEISWKKSEWIRLQPREKVAMLCDKPIKCFLNQNLHEKRVKFSVKGKVCLFKSTKMADMSLAAIQQKRAKNYTQL